MKKIFRIPEIAWKLSGGSLTKVFKLFVQFVWFSVTRKLWLREKPFQFCLIVRKKELSVTLWNNVDLGTLIEVFVDEEYRWDEVEKPRVVVDAGANIGLTALYFSHIYDNPTILALEPSPETFKRMRYNVKNYPNVIPIEASLSNKDGIEPFYVSVSSISSSSRERERDAKKIEVRAVTLPTLLTEQGFRQADLLKFDIEGAEENVFKDSFDFSRARHYIGELHSDIITISVEELTKRFPYFESDKLMPTKIEGRYILRV